jgi:hypothetical protein
LARIRILDPTATPPEVDADPGPGLASSALSAGAFGIRFDLTWRSFDWIRDEWSQALREAGAAVDSWCAGDRTGEAMIETQAALEEFVRAQDVVVVGLGN